MVADRSPKLWTVSAWPLAREYESGTRALGVTFQSCNFREQIGGFVFHSGLHRLVIAVRKFAGFVFEINVPQIFVDYFLALAQEDEQSFRRTDADIRRHPKNLHQHDD